MTRAIICLLVFWFAAASFLPQQSIWTDETTQMGGLSLGPYKVVDWLHGTDYHLGVPFDRAPPLSYWLGQAWAALFGLSIFSMRMMGLVVASLALLITFYTAYRQFGPKAALIAGLLFATSSNLIILAVEIRPYPFFMLWSCCGLYFFSRLLISPSRSAYIGLAISCLLAIYTHFYGLLFTFVLFSILAVLKHQWRPLLVTASVVGLLSLGVLPFIFASFHHSTVVKTNAIEELTRLIYRLLFHVSILKLPLLGLGLFGATGLAILALRARQGLPYLFIVLLGLGLVALLEVCLSTFSAAAPNYCLWMIPALFLFLASARGRWASLFALCLIVSTASGAYQLAIHGSSFSHGPYNQLKGIIEKQMPDVAIAYEGDSSPAAMSYFALHYLFHELPQYLEPVDPSKISQPVLMVIQAQNQSAAQLQAQMNSGQIVPLEPGPLAKQMLASPNWHLQQRQSLLAQVKIELFVFRKQN